MDVYLHLIAHGLAIGVLTGILYVLIALGLTLIYGILHIVNFAHGEIYMLGAMGVFYLYVVLKLPFAVTLVVILVLSLLLGLMIERAFFRSLRGQWLQLVVASVGLSLIIQSLAWVAFGIQEKNVPSFFTGIVSFGGIRLPQERLIAAGVGVILVALLYLLVYRTTVGLAMRAIEEDEETARMLGINADRVAALACAVGFALAALAGAFVAPIYSLNPGMGLEAILMSFLIIIVGGLGSITGTVLAGLLVAIPALLVGLHSSEVLPAASVAMEPTGGALPHASMFFTLLARWTLGTTLPSDAIVQLSPLAFAGWLGLFITGLNLLPIGQLDGGHVARAMFGSRVGAMISGVAMWSLILSGLFVWPGLLTWALIVFFTAGRGAPPLNDLTPVTRGRFWLGCVTFAILVLVLAPVPSWVEHWIT